MNKPTRLLLVVVLLTACQPAAMPQPTSAPPTTVPPTTVLPTQPTQPTPTSAPVETLASSASDILGIWMFVVKLDLNPDGTSRIYFGNDDSPEIIDEGNYSFDAGKLTWTAGSACKVPATYEAYVTRLDGKPTWLRLHLVGTDSCKDRADMLSRPGKFLKP